MSKYLSAHTATLSKALLATQQMTRDMVSKQQIKTIIEVNKYYQQQMKAIAESAAQISEVLRTTEVQLAIEAYRALQPSLESTRNITKLISTLTPTYFTPKESLVLKEPVEVPKKSVAMKFIERLIACPKGKEGWSEYQDLCKEILTYLFVPPLLEPLEQPSTETRLHVRDLILDIPYNISGFWGYIRDKFDSSALIVECKNYATHIKGNQIVISSKYLGENKLGRFGIILSRVDPSPSAIKEASRLWSRYRLLILCLSDTHLIKMLELKEKNKGPEKVIDNAIHEFLRVLE